MPEVLSCDSYFGACLTVCVIPLGDSIGQSLRSCHNSAAPFCRFGGAGRWVAYTNFPPKRPVWRSVTAAPTLAAAYYPQAAVDGLWIGACSRGGMAARHVSDGCGHPQRALREERHGQTNETVKRVVEHTFQVFSMQISNSIAPQPRRTNACGTRGHRCGSRSDRRTSALHGAVMGHRYTTFRLRNGSSARPCLPTNERGPNSGGGWYGR